MPRKEDTAFLVSNCSCQEKALTGLDDETVEKLAANLRTGAESVLVVNELKEGMGMADVPISEFREKLGERLTNLERVLAANAGPDDDEEDDDEDEPETTTTNDDGNTEGTNNMRRLSMQEWERVAPAELVEAGKHSLAIVNQAKGDLASRLVANIKDPNKRKARFDQLVKLDYAALQDRVADLPPVANHAPAPSFFGAAGGFVPGDDLAANAAEESEDIKNMTPPTYDAYSTARN